MVEAHCAPWSPGSHGSRAVPALCSRPVRSFPAAEIGPIVSDAAGPALLWLHGGIGIGFALATILGGDATVVASGSSGDCARRAGRCRHRARTTSRSASPRRRKALPENIVPLHHRAQQDSFRLVRRVAYGWAGSEPVRRAPALVLTADPHHHPWWAVPDEYGALWSRSSTTSVHPDSSASRTCRATRMPATHRPEHRRSSATHNWHANSFHTGTTKQRLPNRPRTPQAYSPHSGGP